LLSSISSPSGSFETFVFTNSMNEASMSL